MTIDGLSAPDEKEGFRDPEPAMVQCSCCGAIGYPADRYCACCGAAMSLRCRHCASAILHRAANYCTQCGASFGPSIAGRSGR